MVAHASSSLKTPLGSPVIQVSRLLSDLLAIISTRGMKQNFTVRQGTRRGVEAFLSVAQHEFSPRGGRARRHHRDRPGGARAGGFGAALFTRTAPPLGREPNHESAFFFARAKPAFEELVTQRRARKAAIRAAPPRTTPRRSCPSCWNS